MPSDYDGPNDLVIRSGLQIIRLAISNRDEIMARADFSATWQTFTCLPLKSDPRTGTYVYDRDGTSMLDVTAIWRRMQSEKYGD